MPAWYLGRVLTKTANCDGTIEKLMPFGVFFRHGPEAWTRGSASAAAIVQRVESYLLQGEMRRS